MSYRSMVKSGKRDLVVVAVNNGFRLASATKNRTEATPFGPTFAFMEQAQSYGWMKFNIHPSKIEHLQPAPKPVMPKGWDSVKTPEMDSKPLGVLPPPDDSRPKGLWDLTVPELRAKCKAAGLKGYSRIAKAGLVEMLNQAKAA